MKRVIFALSAAALMGTLACLNPPPGTGATPAGNRGSDGTGIEAADLMEASRKVAVGLLKAEPIANAEGQPIIVIQPILNDTRFAGDMDIFLLRVRAVINQEAPGKMKFVARDRINELEAERDLKLSGEVTGGEKIKGNRFKGADLVLTGRFKGMSSKSSTGIQSDYVIYTFQLIDPDTSEILDEFFYEVKKVGQDDVVYR